ncbi:LysR family transcriptional regulator [Paremcibacter congregatus]|uniref:LysR family transcriptional regulator n=1 Tax=Paremcibacter congregatus TaxID=2043170 RepID=UPI0022A75000|nr:LysR family transcriptional regulator [Paremcibacter congregatus]
MNILHHLNALRCFEAAARLGSIRAAAEELNVTDGAVSRQVRQLEIYLGLSLFERGHRRISLTDSGTRLAQDVTASFNLLRRANQYLEFDQAKKPIVLAAPASFLLRWLIPRINRLQKALGETPLQLVTWDQQGCNIDSSISVSIRIGSPDSSADVINTAFMQEEFGLVVNPKLLGIPPSNIEEKILKIPRLIPKTRPNIWDQWIEESAVDTFDTPTIGFERMFFTLEAAEAGHGIAIAPRLLVTDSITSGRLVAPFGFISRKGKYYAVTAKWNEENQSVKKVINWFEKVGKEEKNYIQ